MRLFRILTTTSVAAFLASPALAELTAEEVLADQIRQIELYGLEMSVASQSRAANRLRVGDLTMTADLPDGSFSATMPGADFVEQGDGSVRIIYPEVMPITFNGTSPEGEDFAFSMTLSHRGLLTTASGDPSLIRYDYAADEITVSDFAMTAPEAAEEVDLDVEMVLTGMTGMLEIGSGALREYTTDFAIAAMAMMMDIQGPESDPGGFELRLEASDLSGEYAGTTAEQNLMDSFAQMVARGVTTRGAFTHGPLRYSIAVQTPESAFDMAMSAAAGVADFALDKSGLDYGGTTTNVAVNASGAGVPFPPLAVTIAETGGRLKMPVVPSQEPQDFALLFSLKDIVVDDFLWSMIDPSGALPRDPATFVIDVEGTGVLAEDVFDPAYAETEPVAPPGQLDQVTVNRVQLTIAGAELTGEGLFSFDNSLGMPQPSGVANLVLTGGNTLLDSLVAMGLIPEEQAMGARMLLGLFARPGEGPDTLISTIELKEDGSVSANGQRLR